MRAVQLLNKKLRFRTDYEPQPLENAVKVDVVQAGICETDLQLMRGYMGFQGVLGHEFIGVATSGTHAHKRVVGEINCACQTCENCLQGLGNHCPDRTVIGILNHDGAFADHVWVPEENLHVVPDSVSDDAAVLIEPLAAAFQVPAQLDVTQFNKIVVLGDGRLGNLCAQVLHSLHQDLLVIGKHSQKLQRLKSLGITTALASEFADIRCADLVVDCTGSPSGLESAFQVIRPRGTLVLKSTFAGTENPNLAPVVIDELQVVGSRCGPFDRAIQALADDQVEVESLITSRFQLAEAEHAFEVAQQKDQLKVILEINH